MLHMVAAHYVRDKKVPEKCLNIRLLHISMHFQTTQHAAVGVASTLRLQATFYDSRKSKVFDVKRNFV